MTHVKMSRYGLIDTNIRYTSQMKYSLISIFKAVVILEIVMKMNYHFIN